MVSWHHMGWCNTLQYAHSSRAGCTISPYMPIHSDIPSQAWFLLQPSLVPTAICHMEGWHHTQWRKTYKSAFWEQRNLGSLIYSLQVLFSVPPTYLFCQENWNNSIIKESDGYSSPQINQILCRTITHTNSCIKP